MGKIWEEKLSAYFGERVRLIRKNPDQVAADATAGTLVSTASLERLAETLDKGGDCRRFRMLIEADGVEAHEEDGWAGHSVRIGSAEFAVTNPVQRCETTTRNPESGAVDANTLKAIASYRGKGEKGKVFFGVYLEVTKPGTVKLGDEIVFLD